MQQVSNVHDEFLAPEPVIQVAHAEEPPKKVRSRQCFVCRCGRQSRTDNSMDRGASGLCNRCIRKSAEPEKEVAQLFDTRSLSTFQLDTFLYNEGSENVTGVRLSFQYYFSFSFSEIIKHCLPPLIISGEPTAQT